MIPIARPKFIIPTAEPEFTNPCACRIPHSLPSPPLSKGERVGVRGNSSPVHSRTLASQLVSVFALVFQHAPLPTSPVDGGGTATPSPPAGRVGVGAMFKSHCKGAYY